MTSSSHLRTRFQRPSGRAAPTVIIAGALTASAALFFFFTSKRLESTRQVETEARAAAIAAAEALPMKIPAEVTPPATLPLAPKPTTPEKPVFGFARPLDLGKDLAQSLARQDWTRAAQLATAASPDPATTKQASDIFAKIQALGFKAAPVEEVEVLGQVDRFTRLAIPFKGPDGQTHRLQLDVERDENMGWKISQFRLPPTLAQSLAAIPSTPPPAPEVKPTSPAGTTTTTATATPAPVMSAAAKATPLFIVEETQDALGFADGFVRHLLKHDFTQARTFLDESRVSSERLAGLCIVFEEGQYSLLPGKPLVLTATSADASWVIAQVKSEKLDQQTEFGIELQRQAEDQPWRVVGLNLSDILGSFARSASKLGVPYTPIVKNPKGGESLALYFEYDEAGLHPRAQKQLQIVADMLKSDTKRKLRIAGHTDALGAEDYNLRLSQQRAESVKMRLVALGVAPDQVDTTGLGTAQPLGPNQKSDGTDDPEGRSKNRRAEIYLDF